ncbi:unnamed protein product [Orchesella dallaii]|uniref:C3H1-type domain-containing protein n=1 Tax=Orchesella dallaii TaxID=48710 RepID=A0ABP1QZF9_9HEXA
MEMENSGGEGPLQEVAKVLQELQGQEKNVLLSPDAVGKNIDVNWEPIDEEKSKLCNQIVQLSIEANSNQGAERAIDCPMETGQKNEKLSEGETTRGEVKEEAADMKPIIVDEKEKAAAMKLISIDEKEDNEGALLLYEPLEADHALDIGLLREDDPAADVTGKSLFKEDRTKDVPCRFHNGFSQTCWKGSTCPYSHDLYTGGVFAQKHPDIAMAASARREATPLARLPPKPILGKETQILCRITHIESPSEFYIEPLSGANCFCARVREEHQQDTEEKRKEKAKSGNYQLEVYDYGFGCMELPQGIGTEEQKHPLPTKPLLDLLQNFLHTGLNYRKYQTDSYIPKVELVAVKINVKWMRGLVLWIMEDDVTKHGALQLRVQLLETGEKVCVSVKDVCKLPDKFITLPPSAFRCCLFGISPLGLTWSKRATRDFKELVENKEVILTVKQGIPDDLNVNVFEKRPYMVKLLVKTDGKDHIDVADYLINKFVGLQWNPLLYRPFAKHAVDSKELEVLHVPVAKPLPDHAVQDENERLGYYGLTKFEFGKPTSYK